MPTPTNRITARIDAITRIPEGYRRVDPPPPRAVKIELTARCNFACSFCARSHKLRDQHDMDRALYSRLIREFRNAGVEELGLFYLGESFLVPWLPKAIREARTVGFPYVFLTTNGSLATPDRVHACMEAGLNSLKWSLNYADAEQFHDVTKAKAGLWQVILNNVCSAREIRDRGEYECGLYASYILYDGEQGERMAKVVEEVRPYVDEIYSLPLYNQAGYVTAEEKARGWAPSAGNRGRAESLVPPLPCWAVFTEGHVTYHGLLSACCFDHSEGWNMGDLKEMSFLDAWNSESFQNLRARHLSQDVRGTPCEACAVLS